MQKSRKDAQALRSALDKLVESDYKKMGDNVHRFQVLQRMTQDSLAERCLLSAPYISQIERADLYKGVTYQTIIQIAHALGVPACIMLSRTALECTCSGLYVVSSRYVLRRNLLSFPLAGKR